MRDPVISDLIMKEFGSHLKLIREGKIIRTGAKISLRELERLSEIDYSQIHRIEKGHTAPSLLTLIALAKALGVSLNDLVNFEYHTVKP